MLIYFSPLFNGERLCHERAGDENPGHAGIVPGRFRQTPGQGAHSPLGSGQPVLHAPLPDTAEAVGHDGIHAPQGELLGQRPEESVWGTLKNERVHHRRYRTRAQAIQEITEYIEIFYNRQRKQARLGYLSPAAFTQRYYAKQLAA